jgi:short-subunit dehydrogenase
MEIAGRIALITGASEGIGAACAAALRKRGARLSLVARSREKLEQAGGEAAVITAGDLLGPETRRVAIERTVERFGRIDILINNAGAGLYSASWNTPIEQARHLIELNLLAPLELAQLAVAHMKRQRSGTIVNVSSIAGKVTLPWMTLYSVTKFALNSLTDGLRRELRRDGIRVMSVCPGYVNTGFQSHAMGSPPRIVAGGKRFAISTEACAEAIVRGIERNARTVLTPRLGWLFVALDRVAPSLLDAQLARILEREAAAS